MTAQPAPVPATPDDDAVHIGPAIDQFDLEILEFVLSWAPYDGPPEDECVPRFGMPVDRLLARFREIIRYGRRRHLKDDDLGLIERAAALCIVDEVGAPRQRVDRPPPPMGQPVLRRGVWRWH